MGNANTHGHRPQKQVPEDSFFSNLVRNLVSYLFQQWINVQHQKNQQTLRGPKSVLSSEYFSWMWAKQTEEVPGTDISSKPLLKTAPGPMLPIFSKHTLYLPPESYGH